MTGARVLGISALFHDSAAALVGDGRILGAAQEERFTRAKADARFPDRAVAWCRGLAGGPPDAVAFYENPRTKMARILRNALAQAPRGAPIWPRTLRGLHALNAALPRQLADLAGGDAEKVHFVPHHLSHAASAFYPSPFRRAAVLVVDGVGEAHTTTIWQGGADGLRLVREMTFPNSLGLLYSAFTQYCGFKVNSGEYKLMGLAPFGRPAFRDTILDKVIDLKPDGSFAPDLRYFEYHTGLNSAGPLLGCLLGQPNRHPDAPLTAHYMDVAASIQAVTDEIMRRLAATALAETGERALCLAGGVALNCVSNRAVLRDTAGPGALWIQPAAGDAGGALGAALEIARRLSPGTAPPAAAREGAAGRDAMQGGYLGPGYGEAEAEAALAARGLVYERFDDDAALAAALAEALAEGAVAGHFHGRMEYGPRALGNRSILADPRPAGMDRRVNLKIKFREGWRPFAPMVLEEHAAEVFEPPLHSPYMLLVADLLPDLRGRTGLAEARAEGLATPAALQAAVGSAYPAVSHVDYSARLQTVAADSPSRARAVLEAFHARTGCPLLLNTSFNVRGEPIVCSPEDAVSCFLDTHMDVLALDRFLVRRSAQGKWVKATINKRRFDAD